MATPKYDNSILDTLDQCIKSFSELTLNGNELQVGNPLPPGSDRAPSLRAFATFIEGQAQVRPLSPQQVDTAKQKLHKLAPANSLRIWRVASEKAALQRCKEALDHHQPLLRLSDSARAALEMTQRSFLLQRNSPIQFKSLKVTGMHCTAEQLKLWSFESCFLEYCPHINQEGFLLLCQKTPKHISLKGSFQVTMQFFPEELKLEAETVDLVATSVTDEEVALLRKRYPRTTFHHDSQFLVALRKMESDLPWLDRQGLSKEAFRSVMHFAYTGRMPPIQDLGIAIEILKSKVCHFKDPLVLDALKKYMRYLLLVNVAGSTPLIEKYAARVHDTTLLALCRQMPASISEDLSWMLSAPLTVYPLHQIGLTSDMLPVEQLERHTLALRVCRAHLNGVSVEELLARSQHGASIRPLLGHLTPTTTRLDLRGVNSLDIECVLFAWHDCAMYVQADWRFLHSTSTLPKPEMILDLRKDVYSLPDHCEFQKDLISVLLTENNLKRWWKSEDTFWVRRLNWLFQLQLYRHQAYEWNFGVYSGLEFQIAGGRKISPSSLHHNRPLTNIWIRSGQKVERDNCDELDFSGIDFPATIPVLAQPLRLDLALCRVYTKEEVKNVVHYSHVSFFWM